MVTDSSHWGIPSSGKGAVAIEKISKTMSTLAPQEVGHLTESVTQLVKEDAFSPQNIYWGLRSQGAERMALNSCPGPPSGVDTSASCQHPPLSWAELCKPSPSQASSLLAALTTGIPLRFSCTSWITFSQKHNHNHCFAYDAMRSGKPLHTVWVCYCFACLCLQTGSWTSIHISGLRTEHAFTPWGKPLRYLIQNSTHESQKEIERCPNSPLTSKYL